MRLELPDRCQSGLGKGGGDDVETNPLTTLGHNDDAGMVGHPARRSRGSPPVEAHAGNVCYPILFLARQEDNLAREFGAQSMSRVGFQSGVFVGVFHLSDISDLDHERGLIALPYTHLRASTASQVQPIISPSMKLSTIAMFGDNPDSSREPSSSTKPLFSGFSGVKSDFY